MRRAVTVALLLVLTGCSMATQHTTLAASGYALIGVGKEFVDVGQVYMAHCLPAPVPPALGGFCAGWEDFAPRFQQAYPVAAQAWKTAVHARDTAAAHDAEAVILELAGELASLAVAALAIVGTPP